MKVSSIRFLPQIFKKLMADIHSPFDRILFEIPNTHSTGARQDEKGSRKWSGKFMECEALFTFRDKCNGALSSHTLMLAGSTQITSSMNFWRRIINLTNLIAVVVSLEISHIYSPSTQKAKMTFALPWNPYSLLDCFFHKAARSMQSWQILNKNAHRH